jgi:hypothetical protein
MSYIPSVIPHLNKKVGAANFLYQVSINNKLLVSDYNMVKIIIDGALDACNSLDCDEPLDTLLAFSLEKENLFYKNYEKSQILFSLRGILLLNDEGYRVNQ